MSFVIKESAKTGQSSLGTLVVLPSQAEWSDIEEIKQCNRGANEPKSELDTLMKSIDAREGFVTPLKGYIDSKKLFITAGSRRLAAGQALEAEGKVYMLPVVLIEKPTTPEEIANAILDSATDNEFRKSDSDAVLYASFSTLRKMGYSYKEIGEATGFSHQVPYNVLKAFNVKPLKEAILKGEISARAATEYFTEQYKKIDPKTKKAETTVEEVNGKKVRVEVFDDEKIGKALKEAKAAANAAGKGKVGTTTAKKSKQSDKTPAPGMKAVKIILDEPQDNVPTMFRNFCLWLNGEMTEVAFKASAKKNRFTDDIEWLFDIEFDADKRKAAKEAEKAAKDKAKASKASKAKKDNPQVSDDDELDAEDYE